MTVPRHLSVHANTDCAPDTARRSVGRMDRVNPTVTPEFPLFHVAEDHEARMRAAEPAASLFEQGERLLNG